jgi:hypothetical protein
MTSVEARASAPVRLKVTFVSASVTKPWARLAVAVPSSAWEARSEMRWTMVTNYTP